MRTYLVRVLETRLFWDTVEVTAESEEAACEAALEEYQLDWSDSSEQDIEVAVISERAP